jgi:hypothetical protein
MFAPAFEIVEQAVADGSIPNASLLAIQSHVIKVVHIVE